MIKNIATDWYTDGYVHLYTEGSNSGPILYKILLYRPVHWREIIRG